MAEQHPTFPVLFSAVVGDAVELTLCVQHAPETEASGLQTSYKLLAVDAANMRGWMTQFTVASINAALQDEELSALELDQVLATILPCQQAVTAELQPSGHLRLEAWCHRTQRAPLLPPTPQQRQPDSDYRQAAFCISLPISLDPRQPQWMECQQGQAFADINTGLLSALLQRDQQQADTIHILRSQLELLHSHTAQLQLLADRAVRTAVRGTSGLKDDPYKQQQQQQQGISPNKLGALTTRAGAAADAKAPYIRLSQHLFDASQAPGVGGSGFAFNSSQAAAGSGGGGASGGAIPVQRAGSGGSRPLAGAASAGGRAHLARQSQDEKALRQMWSEQQGLTQAWQQQLLLLLSHAGPLEDFVDLAGQVGRAGEVVGGRHTQALPWHLGQQQEQEQQQLTRHQDEQALAGSQQQELVGRQQGNADRSALPAVDQGGSIGQHQHQQQQQQRHADQGMHTSVLPAAVGPGWAAGGIAGEVLPGAAAAAGGAAGPSEGVIAAVAPVRQKAGVKRKVADGKAVLKRGRR